MISYIYDLYFRIIHKVAKLNPSLFTNNPYLTNSNISKIVDVTVSGKEEKWDLSELLKAKSIFVNSERLEELLCIIKDSPNCEYIFAGNSDRNIYEIKPEIPASIKSLFVQNSFIENNEKIRPLPIGIENIDYARNGFKWTMRRRIFKPERKVLIGPFGPTNPTRKILIESYGRKSKYHLKVDFPTNPFLYAKLHRKHMFTLCPNGNGQDTHRVWESIYRGSWPILEENSWSRLIAERYPVILIPSLANQEDIIKLVSDEKYKSKPPLVDSLFMDFWKNLIKK